MKLLLVSLSVNATDLQPVSLQLLWKHQFQFAGYYMAIHKGYYQSAGIDLSIHEYENNTDPVEIVLKGQRDFAIGRSTVLAQKAQGARIVALMSAYQSSPLMLLTTEASGITKPGDLRGKRIMMTTDAEQQVELLAMLRQAGLSNDNFIRQDHSFNIDSLIKGETDAMASYVSNEPYQLQEKGIGYNIIHPKNFGFSMYSDLLFTSEDFLANNPDLVKRFHRATIAGWVYAFNNIEETADLIINKYNSQQRSREALIFEGKKLAELAFDQEGNFGSISAEQLKLMSKLYLLFNIIDHEYSFEQFIYDPRPGKQLLLTKEEQSFIRSSPALNICGDPLWEPYSQLTYNGYEGIIPDYIELIQQRSGLKFKTVNTHSWNQTVTAMKVAKCDLIDGAMQTHNRALYMDFTRPYMSMPAVLAVSKSYNGELDLQRLLRHPVAIVKESAFHEIILARYPETKIVPVASLLEGLLLIQQGDAVAIIDAADSISSVASNNNISEIKILNLVHDSFDISIAINPKLGHTPLRSILNKTIDSITPEEKSAIRNRWIKLTFEHETNYDLMWQIISVVALLVIFLAYRYRIIQLHNLQLQEMARHDHLTGLYNRRMLRDMLNDTTAISNRYNRPVSLIFFDLDDFKQVNDNLGHNEGDKVLRTIADILKNNCRLTDYFGRWGGEEFLIILPETDLSAAEQSAEKLRTAIASHPFNLTQEVNITGSFGVTEYKTREPIDSFVHRADQALYRAKAAGKNCICKDELIPDGPR
ncbi:transporter substrate-binding domain-containing diguanylate cyclase [Amphritea balenae]|nr:ABC transporter substrate-binding protein [Amphritea balenae]GGK78041.1 hypothetical protein GCM10007941_30190 [Amphritea balenae]